ncbi:unnamed protein product [Pleuronectes platessa]|uniref:Uncharacterized protein n=1 Tax=Pleuronectes platessa TaxID=8262 RepID=A0A9N7YQI8_PLEPL|nr:unnamed protein product [Pleuronectes platessa]
MLGWAPSAESGLRMGGGEGRSRSCCDPVPPAHPELPKQTAPKKRIGRDNEQLLKADRRVCFSGIGAKNQRVRIQE